MTVGKRISIPVSFREINKNEIEGNNKLGTSDQGIQKVASNKDLDFLCLTPNENNQQNPAEPADNTNQRQLLNKTVSPNMRVLDNSPEYSNTTPFHN